VLNQLWTYGIHTTTLGNEKIFFVECIAQYFYIHNKIVIISATIRATTFKFSKSASTVHTTFHIPTHNYLSVFHEPNPILTRLKNANIIIINEMSMMTDNMLCEWNNASNKAPSIHAHPYSMGESRPLMFCNHVR